MKKKAFIIAAAVVVAVAIASCAHQTCPAYRGSISMAEVVD